MRRLSGIALVIAACNGAHARAPADASVAVAAVAPAPPDAMPTPAPPSPAAVVAQHARRIADACSCVDEVVATTPTGALLRIHDRADPYARTALVVAPTAAPPFTVEPGLDLLDTRSLFPASPDATAKICDALVDEIARYALPPTIDARWPEACGDRDRPAPPAPRDAWLAPPPWGTPMERVASLDDAVCGAVREHLGAARCEAWHFHDLDTPEGAFYFASTDAASAEVIVRRRPDGRFVAGKGAAIRDEIGDALDADLAKQRITAATYATLGFVFANEQVEVTNAVATRKGVDADLRGTMHDPGGTAWGRYRLWRGGGYAAIGVLGK